MSWRVVTLEDLIDEYSVRPKDLNIDASSLDFYGVSNTEGIIKTKNAAKDKAEKYKILEKDCFAYNPYRINVGSIALLEENIKGLISPAYVVFKPKPKSIIPQLLLMFLKSSEGLRQIKIHARGTVRQALRFTDLCKIKLSLPDYNEQIKFFKRIVETEKTTKQLTTEFTHQLDLVKQLRQAYLKDAMLGRLVTHDSTDEPASHLLEKIKIKKELLIKNKRLKRGKSSSQTISKIDNWNLPSYWVSAKADDILFVTKLAGFEYTKHITLRERGEIPVIRAQNVRPYVIDKTNVLYIDSKTSHLLERCALTKESLLVTFIGAGIGDVARFNESERWHLAPNVAKLEPFEDCEDFMNLEFLNYFLMSPIGRVEIFKHVKATAQPNLSMSTIRDIDLPIPPIKEQLRIVMLLNELMQNCDKIEASIKDSQYQNKLLLQQVLREALGIKITKKEHRKEDSRTERKHSKFDPNTTLMEIVELLKKHGKLHAEELWKMSKYPEDIDAFYAELKQQIEFEKTVKESSDKGYLELV